jgi:ATP-dependent helicase/nuclease subunit B
VTTIWTNTAADVVSQVAAAVRRLQHDQPLRRVYVLTPPGSTAATLRRLLPSVPYYGSRRLPGGGESITGIAGIRFTTIPDLALELAPLAVRAQRPITPLLLSSAVQAQLDRQCPAALLPVKDHPATVDALVQVANRLRSMRLAGSPQDADRIAGQIAGPNAVRRAIVGVAVAARSQLLSQGFRDEATVLAAATAALVDGSAILGGPLVIVATDAVHPAQMPFLEQLRGDVDGAAIVASCPEPDDVDFVTQLARLTRHVRTRPPAAALAATSAPDQDEEARWVVRQIVSLVTQGGVVPEDVAVFYPPGTGYGRSLREELERAAVLSSGPAIETLAGSTAGQVVRLLLGLFSGGADRDAVLHLVSIAPIWPSDEPRRRNVARWRRLCRQANIVVAADWSTGVERLRAAQRARRLRRHRDDESIDVDAVTAADESDIRSLQALVALVNGISRRGTAFQQAGSWDAAYRAVAAELAQQIGTLQWRVQHWAAVPTWQRRAAEQVEVMLSGLRQFDHPATALAFSTSSFRRIVATELDQQVRKAGDTTVGVRLLPLHYGSCVDAAHIFVVGANEGVLPPGRIDDLVVPNELSPACAGVVEHGDWQRHRLRRAWNALTSAAGDVTVTLARTDLRRGGELFASEWLDGAQITVHDAHASGVLTGAALNAAECAARRTTDVSMASASAILHRRALALTSRSQDEPTDFDGLIGQHAEHDPFAHVQGITGFEAHATCAMQYFVTKVLGVDTDIDASEITEIQPRERGNVVHLVLEQLVAEWLDLDPDQRPPWMQGDHLPRSLARAAVLLDAAATVLDVEHKLGHSTSWTIERSLLLTAIGQTLRRDAAESVIPLAAEFRFGSGEPADVFQVDPPADRSLPSSPMRPGAVRFRGSIDRVDLVGDVLRVTDFKTSNAAKSRTLRADQVEAGTKLQPGLYSRVASRQAARFGVPPDTAVRFQYVSLRRGHSEVPRFDDRLLDIFAEPVAATAARLAQGDFTPAIGGEFACDVCTPDDLGRGDIDARVQHWNAFAASDDPGDPEDPEVPDDADDPEVPEVPEVPEEPEVPDDPDDRGDRGDPDGGPPDRRSNR